MGLDNGIIIKHKTARGKEILESNFDNLKDKYNGPGKYEFGYWRKCWNIRERFYDVFKDRLTDINNCHLTLKIEDIPIFVKGVLYYFLDEKNWDSGEYESQVFSWIDELPSIATSIRNLTFFYELVTYYLEADDEDFEIYFYDSY